MKKANEYKYFGEYINENGTKTTTVAKRISEAAGVCNEILALVSSNELKKLKNANWNPFGHSMLKQQAAV